MASSSSSPPPPATLISPPSVDSLLTKIPSTATTTTTSPAPQQADIESLPAYVLEWSPQQRRVKFLRTASELAAELSPANHERLSDSFKRLFVVHGDPPGYVAPLARALDVDPLFVAAHRAKRRFSPLHRRPGDRWVCFDYPELCSEVLDWEERAGDEGSVEEDAIRAYPLSDESADVVVICRASLWLNGENDGVLFLEHPPWTGTNPRYRKQTTMVNLNMAATTTTNTGTGEDEQAKEHPLEEHIASLENILQDALRDPDQMQHGIRSLLSELCYQHWLVLYESPLVDPEAAPSHILALAWRVQLALEHNLNITRYHARRHHNHNNFGLQITALEWDGLLDRNARRVDLATVAAGGATAIAEGFRTLQQQRGGAISPRQQLAPGEKDENSRGLDRISYIGGIVLPCTVVSGILSMGEPFGPTNRLFWVFWAVSVPVTLVTLLVIYADSIRKATVWIEVGADGAQEAVTGSQQQGQSQGQGQAEGLLNGKNQYNMGLGLGGDDENSAVVEEGVESFPMMVVEPGQNGRPGKAWKQQQLGWTGAMMSIVGRQGGANPPPDMLNVQRPYGGAMESNLTRSRSVRQRVGPRTSFQSQASRAPFRYGS